MKEILSGKRDIYFHAKLLKRPPRCRGVPQNQSSSSRWRSCRSQLVEWQLKAEHVVWINTLPRVQPNSGGRQDLRLPCDDRHIRLIIVLLLTHITFTCTVEFPRFFLLVIQKVWWAQNVDMIIFLKKLIERGQNLTRTRVNNVTVSDKNASKIN